MSCLNHSPTGQSLEFRKSRSLLGHKGFRCLAKVLCLQHDHVPCCLVLQAFFDRVITRIDQVMFRSCAERGTGRQARHKVQERKS